MSNHTPRPRKNNIVGKNNADKQLKIIIGGILLVEITILILILIII